MCAYMEKAVYASEALCRVYRCNGIGYFQIIHMVSKNIVNHSHLFKWSIMKNHCILFKAWCIGLDIFCWAQFFVLFDIWSTRWNCNPAIVYLKNLALWRMRRWSKSVVTLLHLMLDKNYHVGFLSKLLLNKVPC